ncbi:DPY30 domain-containing protein 2 [Lemmus lemmus]
METAYLKKCFGNSLTQALAEVARVRPSDPIEYLAHWLYHYRDVTNAKEKKKQEELQLKEEYDRSLQEVKMNEMKKQEEYQTQQKCEKCHEVGGKNEAEAPGILKTPSTGQSTPRPPLACFSLTVVC